MTEEEKIRVDINTCDNNFQEVLDNIRLTVDERDQLEGTFYDLSNSFKDYL